MRLTAKTYPVLIPFILVGCLLLIDIAFIQGAWAQSGGPEARGPGELARGNRPGGMRGGFVERLDKDGDGRVSREEFDGPPDQFDILDRNHDGYLTEDERPSLPPIAGRPPLPRRDLQVNPSSPHEVQQREVAVPEARGPGELARGNRPGGMRGGFVERLDKDGDGRVSREEFDGPPDQFDRLDRNHDGYLTEDERPSLPPIAGRLPLPRQNVQANPVPTPEVQVNLSPTPEVQQSTVAVPQTKEETTLHFWLWMILIVLLAALLLVLVWGLHASRRFKKVRAAVQSLDPHLLGVNIDDNIIITEVTEALCRATGFRYGDLVGKPLMALGSHIADNPTVMHDMWNKIQRGTPWKGEVKLIRKNGSVIWADAVISPLRRKKEKSSGYTVFYQDISKRKQFESMSMHDELTGLFNRRHFNETAPVLLRRAHRQRHSYVLGILDVDNFKAYNDTYGHPAGDRVLAAIGRQLRRVFQRRQDMVFRLGGEEFGAVFVVEDKKEAMAIADKTLGAIRKLKIDHEKNPPGVVTVSMGLRIVSPDDDDDVETIYKKADQALYEAKQAGRNRFVIAES